MLETVYSVALLTRGSGAFAYSYRGAAGLPPGRLCAVRFQHRLELGLVIGPDPLPPDVPLQALWPVEVDGAPHFGALLLELCELSASAPDELAGHLLFDAPTRGLKLQALLHEPAAGREQFAALCGPLSAPKRRALAKLDGWDVLAEAACSGAVELRATVAGLPGTSRSPAGWRKLQRLDASAAAHIGLDAGATVPGSYLAGLEVAFAPADTEPVSVAPAEESVGVAPARPDSDALCDGATTDEGVRPTPEPHSTAETHPPADWDVTQRWPRLAELRLTRRLATWPQLRTTLSTELMTRARAGQRVLLIAPLGWMLDRLWPQFAPAAELALRFRPESGPSAASHILSAAQSGGCIVAGGAGAWKLAAYTRFDHIVLLDPSHPQYAPERAPHLDPRVALLLAAARSAAAPRSADSLSTNDPDNATVPDVHLVELGLSALDGAAAPAVVHLHQPHEPPELGRPGTLPHDADPLPLELRRPDKRRLVYFNRLGRGRGLHCAECFAAVPCPRCGSAAIRYSAAQRGYTCPDCELHQHELRCPRCALTMLTAALPGLEAVTLRPGDVVVQGGEQPRGGAWRTVLGTSQLLEPPGGFWPQQVVYVHAEGRIGLTADWPHALDMLLRLHALYDNPELESLHIVSARLAEHFGAALDTAELPAQFAAELALRRFGGLPPFGCLYHLRATASRAEQLDGARQALGAALRDHPGTELLRLGRSYREGGAHRLAGWLLNPRLDLRALQELRWELHRSGAALSIAALRGPWL